MTTNLTFKLTATAALTFCSLALQAEETVQTSEVTVTAGRVEQQLMDVPMSVSVLTRQEIIDSSARNIGELLADVPGVEVTSDGSQGLKRIHIRGEDAFRNLVLIDGQKISEHKSMSGPALLIDPSSVERIEVIKGPASVLYGSDAIGGVINIITKKGAKKPFEGEASVGWNGAGHGWAESISLGGNYKGLNYQLDAGYQSHGNVKTPLGYQDGTDFRQKHASAFLSYDFNEHFTAGVRAETFDSDINSSSWDYLNDPNSEFFVRIPKWKRDKVSVFAEGKNLTNYLTRLRWDAFWQNNHKKMLNHVGSGPQLDAGGDLVKSTVNNYANNKIKTIGTSLQADWQLGENNFLITGYEFSQDRLKASTTADVLAESTSVTPRGTVVTHVNPVTDRFNKGRETTNAIFAAMESQLPHDFTLNYGVRYTWVNSKMTVAKADQNISMKTFMNGQLMREMNIPKGDNGSAGSTGSDSHSRPVFNLGVIWQGLENTALRAQWSQGFRVPNLQEKFLMSTMGGGSLLGNPDLDPEKSNNFELGARYTGEKLDGDFAIFYNYATDYISTEQIAEDINRYVNADKAKTFGAELSLSYKINDYLNPYASGTWMRRKTEWSTGVSTYDSGTPAFTARYGVRTQYPLFNGLWTTDTYLRSRTANKSYSKSTGGTTRIAGFTTFNFATSYHFGPKKAYTANFEVLNITNQRYGYETSIYEPGRHVNFKLSAKF